MTDNFIVRTYATDAETDISDSLDDATDTDYVVEGTDDTNSDEIDFVIEIKI